MIIFFIVFIAISILCISVGLITAYKCIRGETETPLVLINYILQIVLVITASALLMFFSRPPLAAFGLNLVICIFYIIFISVFCIKKRKGLFVAYIISIFILLVLTIGKISMENSPKMSCDEVVVIKTTELWFNKFQVPSDFRDARKVVCRGPAYGFFEGGREYHVQYFRIEIDPTTWEKWEKYLIKMDDPGYYPRPFGDAEYFWYTEEDSKQKTYYSVNKNASPLNAINKDFEYNLLAASLDHQSLHFYQCVGSPRSPWACRDLNRWSRLKNRFLH